MSVIASSVYALGETEKMAKFCVGCFQGRWDQTYLQDDHRVYIASRIKSIGKKIMHGMTQLIDASRL